MRGSLHGRSVLVAEDEPLIALDIAHAFQAAGANVMTAGTLKRAIEVVEGKNVSAAVLDHLLGDGDSDDLCGRLNADKIPFVIYSGFADTSHECKKAPHVAKPANPSVLVDLVAKLIVNGRPPPTA